MIGGLVTERQERRDEAVSEVSSKWGNTQSVTGPALVVPYVHRWTETVGSGPPIARSETRESKDKPVRYVDIHEDDLLDPQRMARWIRQAAELPGWDP